MHTHQLDKDKEKTTFFNRHEQVKGGRGRAHKGQTENWAGSPSRTGCMRWETSK